MISQYKLVSAQRNATNALIRTVGRWAAPLMLEGLYFRMDLQNGNPPLGIPVDFAGNAIGPLASVTALLPSTDQGVNALRAEAENLPSIQDRQLLSEIYNLAPDLEEGQNVIRTTASAVIVPNHWGTFGRDVTRLWVYYLQLKQRWALSCRVVDFAHFLNVRGMATLNRFDADSLVMTLLAGRSRTIPSLGVVTNAFNGRTSATVYDAANTQRVQGDVSSGNYRLALPFRKYEQAERGVIPNFKFDSDMNGLAESLALIYLGLSPNLTGGLCSAHFDIYIGSAFMNEEGALVTRNAPDREQDVRGTISFDIVLRISRHLDIAALNVTFLTMRTAAEIRSRLQVEKYEDSFGQNPLDGLRINYLRGSASAPINVWQATVRAGDLDTAKKVGLLYKNAPCWGLQLAYGSFWNMLEVKEKTLFSPKSENNCFALAYYHAKAVHHPANLSSLTVRRIGFAARKTMTRFRKWFEEEKIEGDMYSVQAMCDYLSTSERRPAFRVWSLRGVLLFEHLVPNQNPFEIAVGYGRAFAFVDPINYEGMDPEQIKAVRQKYPCLPAPKGVATRRVGRAYRKRKVFKNEFRMAVLDLETTVTGTLYATGFYEFSEEATAGNWTDAELAKCHLWAGPDSLLQFFDFALENFEKGPKYVIFAHFGGGFDFLYYVREALRHQSMGNSISYFSKCLEVQGSVIKLRHVLKKEQTKLVRKNYLNIMLRDSFPLLRASLDRLSKAFKPPHPKKPELIHHELVTDDNWPEMFEGNGELYLRHDLLSLAEILGIFRTKMISLFEIDPIPIVTLPSLSRTVFMRKYYNPDRFPLCELSPDLNVCLRKAYFGGRVEAHQLGVIEGPIFYFDVTSEYPFAMQQDLPYGTPTHLPHGSRSGVPYGLLKVKVEGGWKDRPNLFPVRGPNGLIYPFFDVPFEMYVWSEEVQYSLDSQFPYQFEILEAWEFKRAPYYRECVRDLYQIKREAESAVERQIGKDLVNSGYGIWGMKTQAVSKIMLESATRFNPSPINKYLETMSLTRSNVMENVHFMKVKSNLDGCTTYVPLAVAVTAKARIHLFRLMTDVINAGGRVLYTDTDSIITDIDIGDPKHGIEYWRENENEMGQVKVEFDQAPISRPEVTILGSKFYGFPPSEYTLSEDKYKAKLTLKGFYKKFRWGFMKRNEEKKKIHFKLPTQITERAPFFLTYDHFKDMANGWTLKHDVTRLVTKTRGWINNQCNVGREDMTIKFTMNYKKGKVNDDMSVSPWVWDGVEFI